MVNHLIPDVLIGAQAALGEGPRWSAAAARLLWLDIDGGVLHVTDPTSAVDRVVEIGAGVGAVAPATADSAVLAGHGAFVLLHGLGRAAGLRHHLSLIPSAADEIMNDGACDPQGRFWAGTYAEGERAGGGRLYCLGRDGVVRTALTGVTLSNGLGWSPDGARMYYIDSPTQRIDVFDFEGRRGRISNRRPLVTIPPEDGLPDGLTVDDEGCVWVALWGGAGVRRYTPTGVLDRVVELPTDDVTACAFGGRDSATLFITTAAGYLEQYDRRRQPHAGSLFAVTPGVTGPPASPAAASLLASA